MFIFLKTTSEVALKVFCFSIILISILHIRGQTLNKLQSHKKDNGWKKKPYANSILYFKQLRNISKITFPIKYITKSHVKTGLWLHMSKLNKKEKNICDGVQLVQKLKKKTN